MPSVGFVVSCGRGWDSGVSFILVGNAQTMQALLGGRGAAAEASCWGRACLAPREEARAAQPALSHGILPTATPLKPGRNGTLPAMEMVCGGGGQNWLPSNTKCQVGLCSCGSGDRNKSGTNGVLNG